MVGDTASNFCATYTGPKPESFQSDLQRFGTVRKLESGRLSVECGHFSVGELDLATLANAWHNVEAVCRQSKRITTLPTRHLLVFDTVYLFFSAFDHLTTDNTTPTF